MAFGAADTVVDLGAKRPRAVPLTFGDDDENVGFGAGDEELALEPPESEAIVPPQPPRSDLNEPVDVTETQKTAFGTLAPEAELRLGDDPNVGRLHTGISQVGRGAAGMVAAVPKALGIREAQTNQAVVDALEAIEQGQTGPFNVPFVFQGFLQRYIRFPEERAEIRETLGALPTDPMKTTMFQAGRDLDELVSKELTVNPRFAEEFWSGKVPQGFGSMFGFMAMGVVGRVAGLPALVGASGAGAIAGYSFGFEDAINSGASIEDAYMASRLNAVVGLSEGVPIARILDRIDKGSGGNIRRLITNTLKAGTEEAMQEAFQQISEAVIASQLVKYDPERGLFEGVGEGAAVGFTTGGLMAFLVGMLGGRARGGTTTPPPPPDEGTDPAGPAAPLSAEDVLGAEPPPDAPTQGPAAAGVPPAEDMRADMEDVLNQPDRPGSANTRVDAAAAEAATAPTEGQKAAGNYRKGHPDPADVHGMKISIETAKGEIRSGVDENGKPYSVPMPYHYGYILGTEGMDGDEVDVALGPVLESDRVFIIDQINLETREPDEHKPFVGFASQHQAITAYIEGFDNAEDGAARIGNVTEMSIDEFNQWRADKRATKKPVAPPRTTPFNVTLSVTPKRQRRILERTRDAVRKAGLVHPKIRIEKSAGINQLIVENLTEDERELVQSILDAEQQGFQKRSAAAAHRARRRGWGGPMDLVTFVRSMGGVRDVGGELAATGMTNKGGRSGLKYASGEQFLGKLVNPEGPGYDDMALFAWEAGFFPDRQERPDANEFLDALTSTYGGSHRTFTLNDQAEIARIEAEDAAAEEPPPGFDLTAAPVEDIEKVLGERPETMAEIERAFDLAYGDIGRTAGELDAADELGDAYEGDLGNGQAARDAAEGVGASPFGAEDLEAGFEGEGGPGPEAGGAGAAPVAAAEQAAQEPSPAGEGEATAQPPVGEAPSKRQERKKAVPTPQVAPLAGMTPLGIQPAAETPAQPATETTEQGEQITLGQETAKISQRELLERQTRGAKKPKVAQKTEGEGLFDVAGQGQEDIFQTRTGQEREETKRPKTQGPIRPRSEFPDYAPRKEFGHYVWEPRDEVDQMMVASLQDYLQQELEDAGLTDHVKVEAVMALAAGDHVIEPQSGVYFAGIIRVSLESVQVAGTMHHEIIHALRDLGLFTESEWTLLERQTARDWLARYKIDEAYKKAPQDVVHEEAIAEAYAGWRRGELRTGPRIKRIFERVRKFFEAIANAFRGLGFQTWEDVLSRVESGKVGRRPEGPVVPSTVSRETPRFQIQRDDDIPTPENNEAIRNQHRLVEAIVAGQPIDRMFRLPFLPFLNEHGEFRPGKALYQSAKKLITESNWDVNGRFGWLHYGIEAGRNALIDRYKISDEFKDIDFERAATERRYLMEGADIIKRMTEAGVDMAEAKVFQAVLEGEEIAEADWAQLSGDVRASLDAMGREGVRLGQVSAESYERNRGKWLHRSYLKHESEMMTGRGAGLIRWINKRQAKSRYRLTGETMKGRGMTFKVPIKQLQRGPEEWWGDFTRATAKGRFVRVLTRYQHPARDDLPGVEFKGERQNKVVERVYIPAEVDVPERYGDFVDQGTWEVRWLEGGKAVLWRDFTKEERGSMGEVLDARYNIAKSFHHMARDLANGKFFLDIASNEEWTQTEEPDGVVINGKERGTLPQLGIGVDWVKVPETTIPGTGGKHFWGALAGKYVRPEIWRDLAELDKMHNPNMWQRVLTQWKLNKTARSPVVHMNNILSNFAFMDLADIRLQDLVRGLYAYYHKDADFRDALEHGAFGADMVSQELKRQVLKPLLDEMVAEMQGGRSSVEGTLGVLGKLSFSLFKRVRALDQKMVDVYRLEDEVFRMATYMRRRSLGDDARTAAHTSREQFLNYDIRAPGINFLRRTFLPFIAYTYRAVPVLAQSIATRPWKLAKYYTIAHLANEMAYFATGDDDEEEYRERQSFRDEQSGYTWILTPRMMRMPWRDAYGNPVFLDIRRWIPAGDIFDVAQGSSAWAVNAPLQFGGPLMLAAEFALNKTAFDGRAITNDLTDTSGDKVEKAAAWLWKSWMPSAAWIPGGWYWDKVGRAISGQRDRNQRPYSIPQAVASSFGIKLQSQDIETNFEYRQMDFERVMRALALEAKTLGKDLARGYISEPAYRREMRRIQEKQRIGNERMQERFRGQ